MKIKYGSIEYFELVDLQDRLKALKYNKFGLEYLDKLRTEVAIKVDSIHFEHNENIRIKREEDVKRTIH